MIRNSLAGALLVMSTALTSNALAGPAVAADGSGSAPTPVTPAQKITPYVQPSIVFIQQTWSAKLYDANIGTYVRNEPFTIRTACTGFVVSPDGYIATAGHCLNAVDEKYGIDHRFDIMDAGQNYVLAGGTAYGNNIDPDKLVKYILKNWKLVSPTSSVGDRVKEPVLSAKVSWGENVSGIATAKDLPARIMGHSTFNDGDVGLLKVEAKNLNALVLADGTAETGTDLLAIGYPGKVDAVVDHDYTPSVKPGTVSSYKTVGSGLTSVYEISAGVLPGMSGGPTVNLAGEVIGVNSFGAGQDENSFNFVRPISLIKELMGKAGAKATQSATSKQYFKGLDAYFDGDKVAAVKNLSAVVEEQPANGFASDFLKKAKALPDPKPKVKADSGSSTMWIVGGAVALLLLLLGGLLAVIRGRRKPAGTPPPASAQGAAPVGQGFPPAPVAPEAPVGGDPAPTDRPLVSSGSAPVGPTAGSVPPMGPQMQTGSTTPVGFAAPPANAGTSPMPATVVPAQSRGPAAEVEHHFCTSCGAKFESGTKFCGDCGTPV